jgi:hypothetical protein
MELDRPRKPLRIDLSRHRTQPSSPLRLVALVGIAATVGLVLFLVHRGEPEHHELTAKELDAYLSVAPTIRSERHAAAAEGARAAAWSSRPGIQRALESVGWTMQDYLRVEGQVSAARLRLEDPEAFEREFRPEDAPEAVVDLIRPRLAEVLRVQRPFTSPDEP